MLQLKATLLATAAGAAISVGIGSTAARATVYQQTSLVANGFVPAATIDPQLQSPWGSPPPPPDRSGSQTTTAISRPSITARG